MSPISEEQARQLLAAANSPAASAERYAAVRLDGGWLFKWAGTARPVPVGVRGVVVGDQGRVARLKLGETADQAIARANS
ncbi:MAG: hypothetical protein LBD70_04885 [Bifidobacteriaceae bacterium]|nr:hypothetical protein [Bifidobacteriaceae bacterium]